MEDYIPLAKAVARKLWNPLFELEELESEAMVGLVKWWGRHNPEQSKLSTYLRNKISHHLIDWMRDNSFYSRNAIREIQSGKREHAQFKAHEDGKPWSEILIDRPIKDGVDDRDEIATLMRRIEPIDRAILYLYYLQGLTLVQVGEVLGYSQAGISFRIIALKKRFSGSTL